MKKLTATRRQARKPLSLIGRVLNKAANVIYAPPALPRPTQEIRVRPWFAVNGDQTLRLNYNLHAKAVVFDLGGYEGQWASDIVAKYNCTVYVFEPMPRYVANIRQRFAENSKIKVCEFGLSGSDSSIELSVDEASSSSYKKGAQTVTGKLKSASDFIKAEKIEQIDLMKINIEGGEYDLLDHLISSHNIQKIVDLQVQFHDFVPHAQKRMEAIQQELSKTHFLTYQYPFVWENWRRKDYLPEVAKAPTVSVVMAAYNAEQFLRPAIDSILAQTMASFELIIVNDGSTDATEKIVKSYDDPRIVYLDQPNKGLAAALNVGIAAARGSLIARMDADDLSLPHRLQHQSDYLTTHPDVALVGGSYTIINEADGHPIETFNALTEPEDVYDDFFVRNPFGHGTIMMRRAALDEVEYYDESQPIEDYDLWWRIAQKYPVANVGEVIYQWRVVKKGISRSESDQRQQPIKQLIDRIWSEGVPGEVSRTKLRQHLAVYEAMDQHDANQDLDEQFIANQYALGLAQIAHGKWPEGWKRITSMLSLRPQSIGILSDLYYVNRSVRGYNLHLILAPSSFVGQKISGLIRWANRRRKAK